MPKLSLYSKRSIICVMRERAFDWIVLRTLSGGGRSPKVSVASQPASS